MVRVGLLAVAMLMTLSGCDILSLAGIGGNESENVSANQSAGAKDPAAQNLQFADAGVTSSRSLQPVAANVSQTGEKDPVATPAAFDANLLLGRWGDYGDCSKNVIDFAGDGSFRAGNGGIGQWALDGDQLTFSGDQGEVRVRLEAIDGHRLTIVHPNGSRGQSQRC